MAEHTTLDTADTPTPARTVAPQSKMTEAVTGRILAAIRKGCTREASASAGPVSRSTLQSWIRQGQLDPDSPHAVFADAVADAEMEAVRLMLDDIREQGRKDWRALVWLLQTRASSRDMFPRPATTLEMSGPQGGPIPIETRIHELVESVKRQQAKATQN